MYVLGRLVVLEISQGYFAEVIFNPGKKGFITGLFGKTEQREDTIMYSPCKPTSH